MGEQHTLSLIQVASSAASRTSTYALTVSLSLFCRSRASPSKLSYCPSICYGIVEVTTYTLRVHLLNSSVVF